MPSDTTGTRTAGVGRLVAENGKEWAAKNDPTARSAAITNESQRDCILPSGRLLAYHDLG